MHSMKCPDGFTCLHNGDFSDNVILVEENGNGETLGQYTVPFSVLMAVVAEAVRRNRIDDIEQAADATILFGSAAPSR